MMRLHALIAVSVLLFVAAERAPADEPAPDALTPTADKPGPLRLDLDLSDGSRIIGTPSIDAFGIDTGYARTTIPWARIREIEVQNDHRTFRFSLANGDKISGSNEVQAIELRTVVGVVQIPLGLVRRLRVSMGQPAASQSGLILWNRLGSEDEIRKSEVGPNGTVRGSISDAVPGASGTAAHIRGSRGTAVFDVPELQNKHLGRDALTIEFWAKAATIHPPHEGFILEAFGPECCRARISQNSETIMQAVIPEGIPNMPHPWDTDFHHYALVYQACGRSALYVDGRIKCEGDNTDSLGLSFPTRIVFGAEWQWQPQYDWNGYVYDLRIWDSAKTDFRDRRQESFSRGGRNLP